MCSREAQTEFERGVALLHSFWFDEAYNEFQRVTDHDPQCAMAYWGQGMSLFRQLWSAPEGVDLKNGSDLVRHAQALHAGTHRERDYIDSLAVFYRDYDKMNYYKRAEAYSHAMAKVYGGYPHDDEAAIFYALSLLTWGREPSVALENAKKAIEILNRVFEHSPNEPGVAHYLIHAADDPRLAALGLRAARRYAQIAPASPHALHMPSHIFARLGLWQEDIRSNLATIAATHQPSSIHFGAEHQVHSMDFLEYAYLQIGEDDKAKAMIDGLASIRQEDMDKGLDGYLNQMRAHFPAMYALERHQWKEAELLHPPLSDAEPCEFDTQGLLRRAHIVANWPPVYIGKESDRRWEEGEEPSLLDPKTIIYKRKGYAIATDEQLARIADVPKREFMRRGINQHTLEKICNREPVRAEKLAKCLKVLEEYEEQQMQQCTTRKR